MKSHKEAMAIKAIRRCTRRTILQIRNGFKNGFPEKNPVKHTDKIRITHNV